MNVTKNQIDDLNATLKIELNKEDYATRVDDALKGYQKKAVIDGFRKGKTPYIPLLPFHARKSGGMHANGAGIRCMLVSCPCPPPCFLIPRIFIYLIYVQV